MKQVNWQRNAHGLKPDARAWVRGASSPLFENRNEAAARLASRLKLYQGRRALVLAVPRGGVPMATIIAHKLDAELDVVLVRKLRAPHRPELAIGSVNENGWTYLTPNAELYGADAHYIETEKRTQMEVIRQRRVQYTAIRPPIDPHGRIVIVVDDGLATGATMISAMQGLRVSHPARLICAVPVAPPETLAKVADLADEVVCLVASPYFEAVGQFYAHFAQIEDDEVMALLQSP